jgi:hypothetical protein
LEERRGTRHYNREREKEVKEDQRVFSQPTRDENRIEDPRGASVRTFLEKENTIQHSSH